MGFFFLLVIKEYIFICEKSLPLSWMFIFIYLSEKYWLWDCSDIKIKFKWIFWKLDL